MNEIIKAVGIVEREMDPMIAEAAEQTERKDEAAWTLDPYVPGIVGLIRKDGRALIVVNVNDGTVDADVDFAVASGA